MDQNGKLKSESKELSAGSRGNRRAEHFHRIYNKRQMIEKWVDGHSEDPSLVCAPPPETKRHGLSEMIADFRAIHSWKERRSLTQTACCQTHSDVCWCCLASALDQVTGTARRWRPQRTMGRGHPESFRTVKEGWTATQKLKGRYIFTNTTSKKCIVSQ